MRVPIVVLSAAVAIGVGGLALGAPDPRLLAIDPLTHFSADLIDTAGAYAGVKYAYWGTALLLRWGALIALVALSGGFVARHLAQRFSSRPIVVVFLTMALLLATLAVVTLPLAYASGFRIEQAFGLSTQSRMGWLIDYVRARAFWIFAYSAGAAGLFACLRRWPRHGWVVAATGAALIAVLGTTAAPLVIDPLFHDFTPLADRDLEREIVDMGTRAGIDVGAVTVMDASRRTRRLNAYVTGLGATRRVVLFDNLVAGAPREELLLVVAHEIAHQQRRHVWRGVAWSVPALILGVWALTLLARWQARRDPRLEGVADPAGLPLLWLAVSIGLLVIAPATSAISRGMEAEADWVSLELTGDPDTFVAAKRRLTETNLSWIDPPGWVVRWLYSHPPVLHRIGMAEYWRAERAGQRSQRSRPVIADG